MRSLLDRGAESRGLDYKGPMEWPGVPHRFELIRDILAMANSADGGYLVFGVEDKTWRRVGMTRQQVATFDTTELWQHVNSFTSSQPDLSVVPATVDGLEFVVIDVREYVYEPIVCTNSGKTGNREVLRRGGLYVRTGGAQTVEVDSADLMRQLIDSAVRKRLTALQNQSSALAVAATGDRRLFDEEVARDRAAFGES